MMTTEQRWTLAAGILILALLGGLIYGQSVRLEADRREEAMIESVLERREAENQERRRARADSLALAYPVEVLATLDDTAIVRIHREVSSYPDANGQWLQETDDLFEEALRRTDEENRFIAEGAAVQARIDYVQRLDASFLDMGLDVKIETSGPGHTTLKLQHPLFDRVWAHQMEEQIFQALKLMGFERLEMRNGYGFATAWRL